MDLAADINGHVSAARMGRAPGSVRESFLVAADAGLIPADLATALLPSVGMRNVLIHEYVDVDRSRVRAAVPMTLDAYGRYVVAVRDRLLTT